VLGQIASFLVHTVVTFFVFLLLLRFHFQWLRVPFRNPFGEFVLATTSWAVVPARRVIPGLHGLDLPTLLLAWLAQAIGLWLQHWLRASEAAFAALVVAAVLDVLRYSLYILMGAVIIQVVFSWINPYTPVAPLLDAITRPFLRPLRRFVPPIGNIDLTPLVLIIGLQVILIVIGHLRPASIAL
jgi:YggT family protein